MTCPKCKFENFAGVETCLACGTSLIKKSSKASNDDPFGGFVPAWMQPSPPPALSSSTANQSVAYASSAADGSDYTVSIDELVNSAINPEVVSQPVPTSKSLTVATIEPSLPLPSFGQVGANRETPFSDNNQRNPNFSYAPPGPTPAGFTDPRNSRKQTADKGIYRGCYFYTDEFGSVIVMPLGSLTRRFFGAVIDVILTFFLNIFFWIAASIVIGMVAGVSGSARASNTYSNTRSGVGDVIISLILSYAITNLVPFLYHTMSVGLSGQTIGHRICKIKVIRSGGVTMGVTSSAIRAAWGLAYGILISILSVVTLALLISVFYNADISSYSKSDVAAFLGHVSIASLLTFLLVQVGSAVLVLVLMLIDPGKQGMHDKLADTYVVSNTQLSA